MIILLASVIFGTSHKVASKYDEEVHDSIGHGVCTIYDWEDTHHD